MASNEYHMVTQWRVRASLAEVVEVIGDAEALPRWWPSVYLEVRTLEPGGPDGVGTVVDLYTKGWLPYTLRWQFRVTEVEPGRRIALEAWGDFVGRGVWSFAQQGDEALIGYDWRVRADKPLLRRFSALLKPVFAANHDWAMRMGERSLRLELERRRARTPEELARIPAPPGPTRLPAAPLALLAALGAALALRRLARRGC